MRITGKTDVGLYRKTNQDTFAVLELSPEVAAAVICDGMGGEQGGQTAGETARDAVSERIHDGFNPDMDGNSLRNLLRTAVFAANTEVYSLAGSDSSLEGMGTTVVTALVSGDFAHIVHMGDSRAYLYNRGSLSRLTKDHSLVQELIEKGEITEEQAKNHPQRNFITRAVGVSPNPQMDYAEVPFSKGQKILLCTDGLTNCCEEDEIASILADDNLESVCDELIRRANLGGGTDNTTVVVISK